MKGDRLSDEKNTVTTMIKIYCKGRHKTKTGELCAKCLELTEYAEQRVKSCKFGNEKPVCGKCTVHCYKPEMREKIREVMRYSGPRMIKHPVLLFKHIRAKSKY